MDDHNNQSKYNEELVMTSTGVNRLLSLILSGKPVEVAFLLRKNPDLLLTKGQITNTDGLTFNHVSPYQLILFLCDADMLNKLKQWIPTDEESSRQLLEQDAAMDGGGADLVKIDRDPTLLSFDEISHYIDRSEVDRHGQIVAVTYPLLKNQDGIFFYNNNFYYLNRDLEKHLVSVEKINPLANSQQQQSALNQLRASFAAMENNSSRRSNDDEHELIANTMQHQLVRQGLHYERAGIHLCDTHDEFSLINSYRTYIKLSKENVSDAEIDAFWVKKIGGDQAKAPMWLRQRLCEDRSFIPLPDFKDTPFIRDTQFWNVEIHEDQSIISSTPGTGLGVNYALFKAGARRPSAIGGAAGGPWGAPSAAARLDLSAIRKVIKMGVSDIIAYRHELVTQAKAAIDQPNRPSQAG